MADIFKVFTDKTKEFECKVKVEGASINKTSARLVLEGTLNTVMYEGSIDPKGWCTILVNPIRNIFNPGDIGKVKLEVIAEDTYFVPWESDFEVEAEKKVTVEMVSRNKKTVNKSKPSVQAIIPTKSVKKVSKPVPLNEKRVTISGVSEKLYKHLVESGITQRAVRTRSKKVTKLVEGFMRQYRFNSKAGKDIITKALAKIQR